MTLRNLLLALAMVLIVMAAPLTALTDDTAEGAVETTATTVADQDSGSDQTDEDEEEEGEDDDDMESFFATTTVTATGREESAFSISTPVTVVTEKQIQERLPDNPVDLLRDQPGVDVNGVGPNQMRPVIRGQRGLRVLFMENGLRMNNARRQSDFGEIPGLIDLDSVSTVEVVRGPSSVLYGTDAIGGVLNLVSQTPAYGDGSWLGGSVGLRYGTAASMGRGNLTLDGRQGKFSFNAGVTYRDASEYDAPSGTFGDIKLDEETVVNDTGLTDNSFFGYVGYDLNERHIVSFRFNRYRADETGFGWVDPTAYGESDDFLLQILYPFQDFDRYTFGWIGSGLNSVVADTAEVQLYYQDNERQLANNIDINIGPIFPGAPDSSVAINSLNFTDLETLGTRVELIKLAGQKHVLTYGAEIFQDDSFNTDRNITTTTIRFPFPPFEIEDIATDDKANTPNAENTSYGVFIQDEFLVTERFKATIGARFQDVSTDAKPTPDWDISGLDFSDNSLVGALNLIYSITPSLNILGSYGTAFRAPNIVERLFNGPTPEGEGYQILNPGLVSEESDNIEVGIKYLRRNAMFELVIFRNEIDNGVIQDFLSQEEIDELPQDVQDDIEASGARFVVQQRNIDKLRIDGFEGIIGYRFRNGVSLGGNYMDLDGERIDSDNPPTGDTVNSKLSAYVRYDQPKGRYWVEWRLRHNFSQPSTFDPDEPLPAVGAELPAFTVHNLAGGVTVYERGRQRHTLGIVIANLTDELYSEFSNASFFRPQSKRNYIGTYRFSF
jgi:outer membrane receptor protein involved in Fe transport